MHAASFSTAAPRERACGQRTASTSGRSQSRTPRRFKHCGVHRLASGLACPHHELECWEVALTRIERSTEHCLALPNRSAAAAGKNKRIAKHYHAAPRPDIEVTDPQILVDEGDELPHVGKPQLRHSNVKGTCEVQHLDLVHPRE